MKPIPALASGLCDGMENEFPSILTAKFYEPAPYITLTEHEITVRPLFMNNDAFNAMDAELQEALLRAIDEATVLALQYEREMSEEAQNQMVNEFGVTLYEIDKAPIMERTQEIFSQFGEENGLSDMIARSMLSDFPEKAGRLTAPRYASIRPPSFVFLRRIIRTFLVRGFRTSGWDFESPS